MLQDAPAANGRLAAPAAGGVSHQWVQSLAVPDCRPAVLAITPGRPLCSSPRELSAAPTGTVATPSAASSGAARRFLQSPSARRHSSGSASGAACSCSGVQTAPSCAASERALSGGAPSQASSGRNGAASLAQLQERAALALEEKLPP